MNMIQTLEQKRKKETKKFYLYHATTIPLLSLFLGIIYTIIISKNYSEVVIVTLLIAFSSLHIIRSSIGNTLQKKRHIVNEIPNHDILTFYYKLYKDEVKTTNNKESHINVNKTKQRIYAAHHAYFTQHDNTIHERTDNYDTYWEHIQTKENITEQALNAYIDVVYKKRFI